MGVMLTLSRNAFNHPVGYFIFPNGLKVLRDDACPVKNRQFCIERICHVTNVTYNYPNEAKAPS